MFSAKWTEQSELHSAYFELLQQYTSRGVSEVLDTRDKENVFSTDADRQHYFDVGANAIEIIVQSLLAGRRMPPQSILDFPSGSGRVTRHLRAMFPDAKIGACDLYQQHLDFCASQFGAVPLMSNEGVSVLDVGQWDLVFCGSLLTHLPEHLFWPTIRFIGRSLSPNGIAIVTLEGRHALHIQDHKWKFIADGLFDVARKQYHASGFGFVDYNAAFREKTFSKQASYGIALVSPSWLMAGLLAMDDIRIMGFTERCWDDHQDVIVFGKPAVNA